MNGTHENQMFASAQNVKVFTGIGTESNNGINAHLSTFESAMLREVEVYREDFAEWLDVNVDSVLHYLLEHGAEWEIIDNCRTRIYNAAMRTVIDRPICIELLSTFCKTHEPIINSGYIYALLSTDGLVKIGRSTCPEKRIAAIRTHSGREFIEIYVSHKLKDYMVVERHLHKKFAKSRVMGEWFNVNMQDVIAAIN